MAVIKAPNKQYTGTSAGVPFVNGTGNTDKPHLIEWFKLHGYGVEEEEEKKEPEKDDLSTMSVEELTAYAKEKGIDLGNSTSAEGIKKKIRAALIKGEK